MTPITFQAKLWRYPGEGGWHFLTIPAQYRAQIHSQLSPGAAGYGSVRVEASIGAVTWQTSVFPDKTSGSYQLPVKQDVRRKAGLSEGGDVEVKLRCL
ncbi:MAG: DUF1905 domain-containing protein [Planctomycetota bacterium]